MRGKPTKNQAIIYMTKVYTKASNKANRPSETEITPAMLESGMAALRSFLFEGYQVFPSDRESIVRAIWAAMRHPVPSASAVPLLPEHLSPNYRASSCAASVKYVWRDHREK